MANKAYRGLDLFQIFGIQISIDRSWLIIFALVLWSLSAGYFPQEYPGYHWTSYALVGLVATLLFFASVLVHELSHSLVANRLGQSVRRITLFIFGGMAHLTREPKDPDTELKIAGVGPLTSIVLGLVFWTAARAAAALGVAPLGAAMLRYLGFINIALAVFNLLPGFPLDGGRVARALFWRRSGDLRAATAKVANWGGGIALGLMALGVLEIFAGALIGGLWLIFIAMFLRGAAQAGYHGVLVEQALSQAEVRDIMVSEPVTITPDTTVADAVEHYFLRYGYGGFPVRRDGHLEGLLSLPQVRECRAEERAQRHVADIMRPADASLRIAPSATVSEALRHMVQADTGRLLVMEGEQLVGLITRSGVTRFVQLKSELEEEEQP
jgi:Zn-dependent protease/predicted transcriptional regulator